MYGMNDALESDTLGTELRNALIRYTPELRTIFDEMPFLNEPDFVGKMVQSFVDEYTGYADMERVLREHADELNERCKIHIR